MTRDTWLRARAMREAAHDAAIRRTRIWRIVTAPVWIAVAFGLLYLAVRLVRLAWGAS